MRQLPPLLIVLVFHSPSLIHIQPTASRTTLITLASSIRDFQTNSQHSADSTSLCVLAHSLKSAHVTSILRDRNNARNSIISFAKRPTFFCNRCERTRAARTEL